jgi:CubicO group peptidase (beta-lactamase class C family)
MEDAMNPVDARDLGFDVDRLARVGQAIERDIDAGRCHGVSLVVARRGRVVVDLLEGFADQKIGKRLGRDAVFATMSVGKQLTNVLVLSLVEKGALRLHTPVADVLPEFRTLGKERVNLFHLLTHTSGVASAIPVVPPEVLTDVEKLAGLACGQVLESLPGERVNYSILVAHSVMAAMCVRADGRGRTFAQMIEEDLFRPLGMRDTALGPREDLLARLCPVRAAYTGVGLLAPEAIEGVEQLIRMPGSELPAGGYLTTISDLHRFAEMLRGGGELEGARILSPATIDYCARNHTGTLRNVLFDATAGYRGWDLFPAYIGIGFFVRGEVPTPGPFGVFSSPRTFGGVGAGSTGFWVDPDRELSCAFLSTGLMEDSHHWERLGTVADLIVTSMVS